MYMLPYDKNKDSEETCKNRDFYHGPYILAYFDCSETKLLQSVWYARFPVGPGARLSKYKLALMAELMSALRRFGTPNGR